MKRFDDFLKLLLSILIGQVVKEHDKIREHLEGFINAYGKKTELGTSMAYWGPIFMVMLYLRNIHGSICHDLAMSSPQNATFAPRYETKTAGRAFTQVLSLLALFVIPFMAVHALEKHDVATEYDPFLMMFLLIGPIPVYFVWNLIIILCVPEMDPKTSKMSGVVHNWLRIDAIGLVGAFVGFVYWLICQRFWVLRGDVVAAGVSVLVVATVVFDYVVNASFYFPPMFTRPLPSPGPKAAQGMNPSASIDLLPRKQPSETSDE